MTLKSALIVLPLALFLVACHSKPTPTNLVGAARDGRTDLIPSLARQSADLNARSGVNGWTPLLHAIHKNQRASVAALLDAGADVNATAPNGMTPLMMAAGYGYTDIVNLLLDRGADARAKLPDGENALSLAVFGISDIDRFTIADCQAGTVKALLQHAPDLRFTGPSGVARAVTIAKMKGCAGLDELIHPQAPRK